MSISVKRAMCMGALTVFCLGLGRAALSRFQEKERAVRQACQDQLKETGLSRGAAKIKFFTPEIHMVSSACLPPGGTGEVVVKGKFAPDTKFIFGNDNLEVVKESLVGGEYRATLKVAPGTGPQTASLEAITPVTCLSVRHERAVEVGGKYEWLMHAGNGWKIVARSTGSQACGGDSSSKNLYEMKFYRQGETNPFEKRSATLYFSVYETTNYRFTISQEDPQLQSGAGDLAALMREVQDPKLTPAQREDVMKRVEKYQEQQMANLKKMSDPAYIKEQQAKRQEFGCERIELDVKGGAFTGQMACASKVGTRIPITGVLQALAQ